MFSLNCPTDIVWLPAEHGLQLPQELTDAIIDFLHDDLTTLRSCSLVHSSWTQSCRHHLYAAVAFRAFCDLQAWADNISPNLPNPAVYVRSLSMVDFTLLDSIDLESGFQYFQAFSRVRHLRLATPCALPSPLLRGLHAQVCFSVESLELHLSSSIKVIDLVRFICSFPLLQDLTLVGTNCRLESSDNDTFNNLTAPPFTGSLRLLDFNDPEGEFLTQLARLPTGIHFRSIELDIDPLQDYAPVTRLLTSCSSTLENLKLGKSFAGKSVSSTIVPNISISRLGASNLTTDTVYLKQNHVLRHLTMTLLASRSFSCEWIKSLLYSIVSPHMNDILLQFMLSSQPSAASQFKLSEWESLDKVLTDVVERGVAKSLTIQVLNESDPLALVESVVGRVGCA